LKKIHRNSSKAKNEGVIDAAEYEVYAEGCVDKAKKEKEAEVLELIKTGDGRNVITVVPVPQK
jgi:hypothetical protein